MVVACCCAVASCCVVKEVAIGGNGWRSVGRVGGVVVEAVGVFCAGWKFQITL